MEDNQPHDPMKLAFIFKDVSCSIPSNRALAEWLKWMLVNHKDDLHFLYRHSQAYTAHGGGSTYTFKGWLTRLNKNVNKYFKENK